MAKVEYLFLAKMEYLFLAKMEYLFLAKMEVSKRRGSLSQNRRKSYYRTFSFFCFSSANGLSFVYICSGRRILHVRSSAVFFIVFLPRINFLVGLRRALSFNPPPKKSEGGRCLRKKKASGATLYRRTRLTFSNTSRNKTILVRRFFFLGGGEGAAQRSLPFQSRIHIARS